MLLAEIEIRHSRAIAPTRRVALGQLWLPTDPPPGPGGLLLAGIVAANIAALDEELRDDLDRLMEQVERSARIPQPRLRHRFQTDVAGLDRSHHRLHDDGADVPRLDLDDHGAALPQVLGAVYAAGRLSFRARGTVFRLLRRASRWHGAEDRLIAYLTGDEAAYRPGLIEHDERWALKVLGFHREAEPSRSDILTTFRRMVRTVHPDHGGTAEGAGQRITDLTQAKRILLAEA